MSIRELVSFARANFSGPLGSRIGTQADDLPQLPGWLTDGDVALIDAPIIAGDTDTGQLFDTGPRPVVYGEYQDNPQGLAGLDTDVLAYYLPFHMYDDVSWGIYVREYGIKRLATALNGGAIKPGSEHVVIAAYVALFQHEFFHCLVESAATRIEAVISSATYRDHFDSVPFGEHEEAAANASALNRIGRRYRYLTLALAWWMESQPDGYAKFGRWTGRQFKLAKQETARNLVSLSKPTKTTPLPLDVLFAAIGARDIPTYLVRDGGGVIGLPLTCPREPGLSVYVYTRDHQPPHIHVEIPPRSKSRRLRWPDLVPLDAGPGLSVREAILLNKYVKLHHEKIDKFVQRVPWTGSGITIAVTGGPA